MEQQRLFAVDRNDGEATVVNDRVTIRANGEHRVVVVDGMVVNTYPLSDRAAEAYAMVFLIESDYAHQTEVARAFGYATRTLRRCLKRFDVGGLAALGRSAGRPAGTRPVGKLGGVRDRAVLGMKSEGLSNREAAKRLGISEKAVRKRLKRLEWKPPSAQALLFGEASEEPGRISSAATVPADPAPTAPAHSAPADSALMAPANPPADPAPTASVPAVPAETSCCEPPAMTPRSATASAPDEVQKSLDRNPLNRWMDRMMAKLGALDDAEPLFAPSEGIVRGGVLLAVPGLLRSGVLEVAQVVYGRCLTPAFYGLRTTIVVLVFLALLRIKRPEGLKEHAPADLGRLVGLDRAPEVKTLRRKLTRLATRHEAERFGRELARRWVAERGRMLGFLYIDGHVRVYHGKHALPKAHVPQRRLAVPATTDYWVNDAEGEPVMVVTAEANAGMHRMLLELSKELRELVGPERRPTLVFDRGGWSPKLFAQLMKAGFEVLTYRRGRSDSIPESSFHEHSGQVEGRRVSYRLHDREVSLLKGALVMREVRRLTGSGHQTAILTSRKDLSALEVAYRMFERWRQENFFKYVGEEYSIDALVDYEIEPDDPNRSVPNPDRRKVAAEYSAARAELAKLIQQYGKDVVDRPASESSANSKRGLAHAKLKETIHAVRDRLAEIKGRRDALEKRVTVAKALGGKPVVKLSTERKHLTNVLKMIAYQVESGMVSLVRGHYSRVDEEGRTLIQSVLQSTAALTPSARELHVQIVPLSSPHRSRAIAAACESLNRSASSFPGTQLTLRYDVDGCRVAG